MTIEKLEAALRALGWTPIETDTSVTTRAWKRIDDDRPVPMVINVPRTDWVHPRIARRILRNASRIELR